jgi:trans-aconitate methyltransferase
MHVVSANDAVRWAARWDEQQERYLPHREERFRIILDVVERLVGSSPRLLDVCCGTGSISRRALERFPNASIIAADMDPAHLELGRRTLGDRVDWRDLDLRQPGWAEGFEPGSFDAAVSATAIHWFQPEEAVGLYKTLAALIRDGGVFANADHMPASAPDIAALSEELLEEWRQERLAAGEDYYAYRDALREDDELRGFVLQGDRRFENKHPGATAPEAFHREALLAAGFRTADVVWRHHADAILVALR